MRRKLADPIVGGVRTCSCCCHFLSKWLGLVCRRGKGQGLQNKEGLRSLKKRRKRLKKKKKKA